MPKPEKHVFVCVQNRPPEHPRPSCGQKNCAEIAEEFYSHLQQSQLFDKIQVTTTGCLGPCSEGPTVLVYPEGIMYGGIKKDDVATIFNEHLRNNKPVEQLMVSKTFWS
ncbi:MAG: (2Fe-2S) ferredoxin domain-containing protein [gamma proteobacterium symbiont of Bathyaustriella thionipta]|nr:(2Fe-2S) ferredoxin domain-containing protein [gamma proteobacterium symbiont of Bathyaustriella thionipta]MCU7950224.1 (2Fe-2S) ferredoxin domain-containing protein [gamma proteobacterium symbiont of Bathyaustriella thionipta]MCU7952160.1 (2Fe-2S) ferredoxin domain-containing protein [gamma proteobacterium symbiont of Bathyaustriella thionipta]MCU7956759.1 (2Fe-2S) ferredoxin domain-containing protein [gamma proteobacterium symbiont of Bathyaustriella thionipta]